MAAVVKEDLSINTIIGSGTSVSGDIESAGFTRVDGSVHGDVKAKGRVIIGEDARMKSNVNGTMVTVGGVVFGNIIASERIIILSTGLVLGDIITRRIQADEGCLLHGQIKVCQTDEALKKAITEHRDMIGLRESLGFGPRELASLKTNGTETPGQYG